MNPACETNHTGILQQLTPLVHELAKARTKFPDNHYMLEALAEEIGEMAEAWELDPESAMTRKEAIQVACVAMRIATEGAPKEGSSPKVLKALKSLEALARKFWDTLPDRPDLSARSHPDYSTAEEEPVQTTLRITVGEGVGAEECKQLLGLINAGLREPDFSIVVNFPVQVEVIRAQPVAPPEEVPQGFVPCDFEAMAVQQEAREKDYPVRTGDIFNELHDLANLPPGMDIRRPQSLRETFRVGHLACARLAERLSPHPGVSEMTTEDLQKFHGALRDLLTLTGAQS